MQLNSQEAQDSESMLPNHIHLDRFGGHHDLNDELGKDAKQIHLHLICLAILNPELAKEMMDFMKEERQSSHEPIAVRMVKAEEDKLTFTEEQKKWAFGYIASISFFVILVFSFVIGSGINANKLSSHSIDQLFWLIFFAGFILIMAAWFCAYKAGMPAIKQFMSKHFTLLKE